jgi:hypothetical protein
MSLIKPSFVESLFHTFFNLDPDRPQYFNLVFRLGRSMFLQLGFENKAEELQKMIEEKIEKPLSAPLFAVLQAYYNPRFMFSRIAYCKVGQGIDAKEVTRYEMTVALEEIKDWVYDEVTNLTPYVRFTRSRDAIL